jgi:hypothetical protein
VEEVEVEEVKPVVRRPVKVRLDKGHDNDCHALRGGRLL